MTKTGTNPSPLVMVPFKNYSHEGLFAMYRQKGDLLDDDKTSTNPSPLVVIPFQNYSNEGL